MNVYDWLKAIGQVILPSLVTCVVVILQTLGVECADNINIILTAIITAYNSIIIVWNKGYYQNLAETQEEEKNG
jgi:hypothetical protein